jgi:hypothetical protein
MVGFWSHGAKYTVALVDDIMPVDHSAANSNLMLLHFPEVPMRIMNSPYYANFWELSGWKSLLASTTDRFPDPHSWVLDGCDYGAFAIRNYEAFYICHLSDRGQLMVRRLGLQSTPPPVPDPFMRDVKNVWKGAFDDFKFEKAFMLDTTCGPKVAVARFWAYPTRGHNPRYLHLTHVSFIDQELVRRARCGNLAPWSP